MKSIIIYGSCYGTTEKYALAMSQITGTECVPYDKIDDINAYDKIIYFGGLYAGGVLGLSKTFRKLEEPSGKDIVIITVGLADPTDQANIQNIIKSMKTQISQGVYENAKIFHLRGGIDYEKLNFKHRTMMSLLYNKVKKMPPEKQNAETKAMIETYNQKVDFVDLDKLNDIIGLCE